MFDQLNRPMTIANDRDHPRPRNAVMSEARPVHRRARRVLAWAAAAALVAGAGGCGRQAGSPGTSEGTEGAETAEASSAALTDGRHRLTGMIVSGNPEKGTLLVQHDEIPGFMPAMTMEFKANSGDVANARPGQRIRAVLYQADDGFYLEQIWPEDPANVQIVEEAARALRQDTVTRGSGVYREVGERLPDFALYDQNGDVVQASRFRGHPLLLNFIFTRCPDPNMCPAAVTRMVGVQKLAREEGITNLELISITLDPEFDTPGVLRDYAEARKIDTSNYSFLTGPEAAIKDLLAQLGVLTFQDGPLIRHTLATVLIDPQGKIIHRVDGSTWEPADFVSRLPRPEAGDEAAAAAAPM